MVRVSIYNLNSSARMDSGVPFLVSGQIGCRFTACHHELSALFLKFEADGRINLPTLLSILFLASISCYISFNLDCYADSIHYIFSNVLSRREHYEKRSV